MNSDENFKKYHSPKPCIYCGCGAEYSPIEETSKFGFDLYFCFKCLAEYVYLSDKEYSRSIYTTINNKSFRLTHFQDNILLYSIGELGIPGEKVNKKLKLIKNLKSISDDLNITPENFNDKLRAWLAFI